MSEEVKIGEIFKGKVINIKPYGAFVAFDDDKKGLIHISHISDDFVKDINDFIHQGDEINVKVLSVDEKGKIALSMKGVEQEEREIVETEAENINPSEVQVTHKHFGSSKNSDDEGRKKTLDELIKDFNRQSNDRMVDINRRLKR